MPDPNFSTTYSDFDGRFYKQFGPVVKSQAFFPANGNKEYYGDGAFWDNFPMPGSNHSWYSYDWGDAHILVLDSEQPFASAPPSTPSRRPTWPHTRATPGASWPSNDPPYSSTTANSSSHRCGSTWFRCSRAQHVDLVLSGQQPQLRTHLPADRR